MIAFIYDYAEAKIEQHIKIQKTTWWRYINATCTRVPARHSALIMVFPLEYQLFSLFCYCICLYTQLLIRLLNQEQRLVRNRLVWHICLNLDESQAIRSRLNYDHMKRICKASVLHTSISSTSTSYLTDFTEWNVPEITFTGQSNAVKS